MKLKHAIKYETKEKLYQQKHKMQKGASNGNKNKG